MDRWNEENPASDVSRPSNIETKKQRPPRRVIACNFCRVRKIRCNGQLPCLSCVDRGQACELPSVARQRPRAKLRSNGAHGSVKARLAVLEALVERSNVAGREDGDPQHPDPSHERTWSSARSSTASLQESQEPLSPEEASSSQMKPIEQDRERSSGARHTPRSLSRFQELDSWSKPALTDLQAMDAPFSLSAPARAESMDVEWPRTMQHQYFQTTLNKVVNSTPSADDRHTLHDPKNQDLDLGDEEARENGSLIPCASTNFEYHGPRSYLSIVSKPAVQWVVERTDLCDFRGAAEAFALDITRRLRINNKLSAIRIPEPDPETAWKYTKAYFDHSLDVALGIVNRPWFETQLEAHFNGLDCATTSDASWYALRNAVYACGSKIIYSEQSTMRKATQVSWGFFENALSVHVEILYYRTSLVGIQALTLMAYYSDSISNPCLTCILISNSMHLAVSKGLHRRASASWNLSQNQVNSRNWLFWAIYCMERADCCRSGRPPVLDDDDITCQVPTLEASGSSANVTYRAALINLARLSSAAVKQLSNVRTFQQKPDLLVKTVALLNKQLEDLKHSIEPFVQLESFPNLVTRANSLTLQHTAYLCYTYYRTVLDINTALTYPWHQNLFGLAGKVENRTQLEKSSQLVAKVCRDTILASRYLNLDASTPALLSFMQPFNAMVNLFIHILHNPTAPEVRSDLAVMDMGAGHFARLEFASDSEVCIRFGKAMAAAARHMVTQLSEKDAGQVEGSSKYLNNRISSIHKTHDEMTIMPSNQFSRSVDNLRDEEMQPIPDQTDLVFEDWSTPLPALDAEDYVGNLNMTSWPRRSIGCLDWNSTEAL